MPSNQPETCEFTRGWEHYPSNIPTIFSHENPKLCHRRLQKDAKRLFNSNSEAMNVRFETVLLDVGVETSLATLPPKFITDSVKDEKHLEDILIVRSIYVPQSLISFNTFLRST